MDGSPQECLALAHPAVALNWVRNGCVERHSVHWPISKRSCWLVSFVVQSSSVSHTVTSVQSAAEQWLLLTFYSAISQLPYSQLRSTDLAWTSNGVMVKSASFLYSCSGTRAPADIASDRKSTRLNSSHVRTSRMPSSA